MRILIVDDDPELLRLLALAFRARGHEVEVMAHGLGVIHRLTGRAPPAAGPWGDEPQPAPDVCILDNYLPEISGVAILSLAMRTRGAMDVPVVVYSSDAAVEAAVAAVGHPRAYFALKTGRVRELVDRVETLVAM